MTLESVRHYIKVENGAEKFDHQQFNAVVKLINAELSMENYSHTLLYLCQLQTELNFLRSEKSELYVKESLMARQFIITELIQLAQDEEYPQVATGVAEYLATFDVATK
jgi:hypothetical protein